MKTLMTRRLGFVAVLGALAALAGGLVLSSGALATSGTLRVGSLISSVGLERSVNLEALDVGAPGLGAWTLNVSYDPAVVSVVSCRGEQGGLCNPAYTENTARVAGMSVFGVEGDNVLASIVFGCVQAGSSDLVVTIDVLADATLGGPLPIDATVQNGTATCLEEGVAPPAGPVEYPGDANCDTNVDSVDAALVLQFDAGLLPGLACHDDADYNNDGAVNSLDAAVILQHDAGLIT